MKNTKRVGSLLFAFLSVFILVGCSKKEKQETQKLNFGETGTYKSDDGKNVAEIKFYDPYEVEQQTYAAESLNKEYGKYSVVTCVIKCKSGSVNPHELSGKKITASDEKGNILDAKLEDQNKVPETLKEGKTLKLSYVFGLDKDKSEMTIDLKNLNWSGEIKDSYKDTNEYEDSRNR
ncbi:hypothetical protein [Xylocopilactobacillus apicola]|uniref:DUF5067 domain-containing protein n=1 Tax=Xylocopilactobacillus apicola TaxID=2932184 RepID=A0AAU9DPM5_9LACO|nr:hypothetical protein [Xylocopilactobacillus apicola]BDR59127.1 hypothetical protein XA3_15680 [Xylocopilactobacillus apicola]